MNPPEHDARTNDADNAKEGAERQRARSDRTAAARFRRASIEFLLRFSDTDPVALAGSGQPGDLINLVYNLYRFGYIGDAVMTYDEAVAEARDLADALRAKPERLGLVIEGLKSLLGAAADGGRFELPLLPGSKAVFDFVRDGRRTNFLWSPRADRYAGLRQAIIHSALHLLATEEGEMVRRCTRDACQRIFLAKRPKQIFCTRACASAAVFERYKQTLGEAEYRAKRREQFAKRQEFKRRQAKLAEPSRAAASKKEHDDGTQTRTK